MATYNIQGLDLSVTSFLADFGAQDDGHPFIGEKFCLHATFPDGRRFQHQQVWPGARREIDDETGDPHFLDLRAEARTAADRLLARIIARGSINTLFWYETDPVYGSDEYMRRAGDFSNEADFT